MFGNLYPGHPHLNPKAWVWDPNKQAWTNISTGKWITALEVATDSTLYNFFRLVENKHEAALYKEPHKDICTCIACNNHRNSIPELHLDNIDEFIKWIDKELNRSPRI